MIQLARMSPQLRTTNMAAAVEFYTDLYWTPAAAFATREA